MKKIMFLLLGLTLITTNASARSIADGGCVAKNNCGYRNVAWLGGTVAGAAAGPVIAGLLGLAAAPALPIVAASTVVGLTLGGKLGTSAANEYIALDNGQCLECDSRRGRWMDFYEGDKMCDEGSVVTNGLGTYKCGIHLLDDAWESYTIPFCSNSPVKSVDKNKSYNIELKDSITNGGRRVSAGVYVFSNNVCKYVTEKKVAPTPCKGNERRASRDLDLKDLCKDCDKVKKGQCYNNDMLDCYEAISEGDKAVWNKKQCLCTEKNEEWDPAARRCKKKQTEGFCTKIQKQGATAERLKCCRAGSATRWEDANGNHAKNSLGFGAGEKCVCVDTTKEWNSATGKCEPKVISPVTDPVPGDDETSCAKKYPDNQRARICCEAQEALVAVEWNEKTSSCDCFDSEKKFDYDDRTCKATVAEAEEDCYYDFDGRIDCANGRHVSKHVSMKLDKKFLKNGMTCDDFNRLYHNDAKKFPELMEILCRDYSEAPELDAATKGAIQKINRFFSLSDANKTVWRDTEGKFNTTRLASDATAGVVLGTVGGVVSAKIIKKKQLEKGFDVLHCVIGGQKVADYGDTFNVTR